RALALLWQVLSGAGFPNQFFCDSWVVGFWRGPDHGWQDVGLEEGAWTLSQAVLVQLSGRNNRNASMIGTSPRASVSDTRVWQFAVLPSADAYCAATPTECAPFLGIAVSSITSTASLPPTSLSAWTSSSVSTGVASQTPA